MQPFDGDLDDYQRWLLEVSRATATGLPAPAWQRAAEAEPPWPRRHRAQPRPSRRPPASRDERKADKQARAKRSDATRPLRVELQQVDARLARLAAEKAEVEAALAGATAPPDDYAELRPPPDPRRRRDPHARRALAGAAGRAGRAGRRLITAKAAAHGPHASTSRQGFILHTI